MSSRLVIVAFALAASACLDSTSATDLHTDGPPKVEQVRLSETYLDSTMTLLFRRIFAFGTHPQALPEDAHATTSAFATGQSLRVIMDQLLRGNRVEEVMCRGAVKTGPDATFDHVPDGATPDDVALCAVQADALPSSCQGVHAMCICQLDGGCMDDSMPPRMIAKGQPVGVEDQNLDGAADETGLIPGVVGIKCGSIDVPLVHNEAECTTLYANPLTTRCPRSYWQPSGFQEVPAVTGGLEAGFELLGPALVLVPAPAPMPATSVVVPGALPTNTSCTVVFDASVTNKRGETVCAPPDGNPDMSCTPGDTSLVQFKTAPLAFFLNQPPMTDMDPVIITTNAAITESTLMNVTVTLGGNPVTGFTFARFLGLQSAPTGEQFRINPPPAGWGGAGNYVITFPTTVKDAFGVPPPAPVTLPFTL